jgi:hypothetical protein
VTRPIPSAGFIALVDANAPLWAGEAAVFDAYWDWPQRDRASDLLWLGRQAHKELVDGVEARLSAFRTTFTRLHTATGRAEARRNAEAITEELAHFCGYADAYDVARDGAGEPLDADTVRAFDWPENRELMALRRAHKAAHGGLGDRAHLFTEGGYCTLYRAGAARAGAGPIDDAIAVASELVFEDEFDHMMEAFAGLDGDLSVDEWALLTQLTVEQGRARIHMRNAQFSYPLTGSALDDAVSGRLPPLPFDYERAGFALP